MPHIHKKIDFCVETYIVHNNKVLLRKHDKYKLWLSVGGHIELDEDPNEAAIREVKEEVGLEIKLFNDKKYSERELDNNKLLIPPQYLNKHFINEEHQHIGMIYFAIAKTNKLKLSDKEISEECRWFAKEELLENKYDISELVRFYASDALKKVK